MPIPCSAAQREYEKFTECQGKTAVRAKICQDDGDALKVEIGERGVSKNVYNDVSGVPEEVETLVATYTVPVGKKFDFSRAVCSGDNIARFVLKINGDVKQGKRTWWVDFNAEFNVNEDILSAGDKVEIFVINRGKGAADFEGTIIGGEYNV